MQLGGSTQQRWERCQVESSRSEAQAVYLPSFEQTTRPHQAPFDFQPPMRVGTATCRNDAGSNPEPSYGRESQQISPQRVSQQCGPEPAPQGQPPLTCVAWYCGRAWPGPWAGIPSLSPYAQHSLFKPECGWEGSRNTTASPQHGAGHRKSLRQEPALQGLFPPWLLLSGLW